MTFSACWLGPASPPTRRPHAQAPPIMAPARPPFPRRQDGWLTRFVFPRRGEQRADLASNNNNGIRVVTDIFRNVTIDHM